MNQQVSEHALALWHRLVESTKAYDLASYQFLSEKADRVGVLRQALRGRDGLTAIRTAAVLSAEEKQELFSEWIHLARCAHGPFEPAWKTILALPRDWVLAHIEPEVDAILRDEEETDYWMFLQLYDRLDRDLTLRLARRAAAHADSDIRELGEDYLEKLLGPSHIGEACPPDGTAKSA